MKIYTFNDTKLNKTSLTNGVEINHNLKHYNITETYLRYDVKSVSVVVDGDGYTSTVTLDNNYTYDVTIIPVVGQNYVNHGVYGSYYFYTSNPIYNSFSFTPKYRHNGFINKTDRSAFIAGSISIQKIRLYADYTNISNLAIYGLGDGHFTESFSTDAVNYTANKTGISIITKNYIDVWVKSISTFPEYGVYLNYIYFTYTENSETKYIYLNHLAYCVESGTFPKYKLYVDGDIEDIITLPSEITIVDDVKIQVSKIDDLGNESEKSNIIDLVLDDDDIKPNLTEIDEINISDSGGVVFVQIILPSTHNIDYILCNNSRKSAINKNEINFELTGFEFDKLNNITIYAGNEKGVSPAYNRSHRVISGVGGVSSGAITNYNFSDGYSDLVSQVVGDLTIYYGSNQIEISELIAYINYISPYFDFSSIEIKNESNSGYGNSSKSVFEISGTFLYFIHGGKRVAKYDLNANILYAPNFAQNLDYIPPNTPVYIGDTYNYIAIRNNIVMAFNESDMKICIIKQI